DYEELVAGAEPVDFHVADEDQAASMCYTSGTTGNPKGVVYSHRSTFLHTYGVLAAGGLGPGAEDGPRSSSPSGSRWRRACPPSGWVCSPSSRAATFRACAPSRAAARLCHDRWRGDTAGRAGW